MAAVTGMDYGGEIDGVIVKGIIKGTQFVGAIAGTASDTNDTRHKGIISNSGSEGTVTAIVSRAGGVVGNGHYFILDESYSKSNVDANYEAGGLAGTVWFGTTITRSYATGNVHAAYDIAGGLVSGAHGLISNSYATGNVSGIANVGGLMGVGGAIILNSYSTGNVNGTNYFGGLIGYTIGDIDNSFTISSVNIDAGDTNFGGLAGIVGDNWGGGAYNSFWDINNTTQPKAYAYYDHVPTGHGNNDYDGATGINTTPKDYAYWYNSNSPPLSSWGGFGADKNWSNCENRTLPWLTWESRNCQRTE